MKFNLFYIGAICSVALSACSSKEEEPSNKKITFTDDQLKGIDYSASKRRPVLGELLLNGKVVPDENNLVNVYPMIGGIVIDVNFEIGDLVDLQKPLI